MGTYRDIRVKFEVALNEATKPTEIIGITNPEILSRVNKTQIKSIESFLNNVPTGDPTTKLLEKLNGFGPADAKTFVEKCGKYTSVDQVASNYQSEIGDKTGFELYKIKPDGAGRGEIWLAWLIKDAKVSGGGESFDLLVGKSKKYEVKEYNIDSKTGKLATNNSPFRLGNAGALSNFKFGDKMTHVVDIAIELGKLDTKSLPNDLIDLHKKATTLTNIKSKYGTSADFKRGEISQAKFKAACDFIVSASNYIALGSQSDYNIVTFSSTSAGNPNLSYILPSGTTKDNIEKLDFKIGDAIDLNNLNSIVSIQRMLVKVDYIRSGLSTLIDDINDGLNNVMNKYKGVTWIVFRKSSMNVSSDIIRVPSASSNEEALKILNDAYGNIFNVSSASVRVKESV
jgi:hypothetical protein